MQHLRDTYQSVQKYFSTILLKIIDLERNLRKITIKSSDSGYLNLFKTLKITENQKLVSYRIEFGKISF